MILQTFSSEELTREEGAKIIQEALQKLPGPPNEHDLAYLFSWTHKNAETLVCPSCGGASSRPVDILFSVDKYILDVSLTVHACAECRYIDYDRPFTIYTTEGLQR